MTDRKKLKRVIAEVERRIAQFSKLKGKGTTEAGRCFEELSNELTSILSFIDSLEEEPVSEELEEEIKKIKKDYFQNASDPTIPLRSIWIEDIARHFANWQKNQMEKEYSDLNKGLVSAKGVAIYMAYETGKKDIIGKVRSILNKVAYKNNGLDVNGDYCEQPYVELDNEFRKLLIQG